MRSSERLSLPSHECEPLLGEKRRHTRGAESSAEMLRGGQLDRSRVGLDTLYNPFVDDQCEAFAADTHPKSGEIEGESKRLTVASASVREELDRISHTARFSPGPHDPSIAHCDADDSLKASRSEFISALDIAREMNLTTARGEGGWDPKKDPSTVCEERRRVLTLELPLSIEKVE